MIKNKSLKHFRKSSTVLLALVLLALSGCASQKSTFYWGEYEDLLYSMYIEPGSADSTTQISTLVADIEKAEANNIPVAPGIHAHLGYMYALEGNVAQSKAEFMTEKSLFPESAVLIDGMMNRLEGAK
ncbi:DUF4810 domain-containing protein [Marinomonas sp. A79]|uniref:DUF4810 domain-containing protein n=1 Tax=Marinomonas vulgaris TaxID=2823372 RepID=A0ABS5H9V3_9GAMM|nr:DUF4810 domain-containing protein [Marinomonas vulgaris]MBR7888227.1 DUF4810 domain-containing protein [Marinomonas vulgaris]